MTILKESLLIDTNSSNEYEIEVFLNSDNEIFIGNDTHNSDSFYFTLNEKDWNNLKSFIDKQFNNK